MNDATGHRNPVVAERRWSGRLICWVAVLTLANRMADTVITTPQMVLPQMLEHFGTDQVAWLNSSALLAGAIWSPLLAKGADIFGKRRVLLATILLAGVGSVVCLVAPNLGVFLLGRLLQGAAMAVVFLTVALTRQIFPTRTAMTAIGIVTSCSAVVGIVEPFLMIPLIERFGFQSVFVVSVALAAVSAASVLLLVPESPVRTGGRVDVVGALLLGGGLAAVLGYSSLGQDLGWLSAGMLALLVAGVAALGGWVALALRVDEPIVDLRALSRPLVLMLLAVVLAAGSFQSVLQLTSLIAEVSPALGLGYGLSDTGPVAVLFAAPAPGIMLGGTLAGWLATRIGPARTLLGGIAIGTVATFVMLAGVSSFPLAIVSVGLLGTAAGAIGASAFNLATGLAPPERHGVVTGLVSLMLSVGGVVVTVAGTVVLNATATEVDGTAQNSATGVYLYLLVCGILFALATVTAMMLVRKRLGPQQEPDDAQAAGREQVTVAVSSMRPSTPGPRPTRGHPGRAATTAPPEVVVAPADLRFPERVLGGNGQFLPPLLGVDLTGRAAGEHPALVAATGARDQILVGLGPVQPGWAALGRALDLTLVPTGTERGPDQIGVHDPAAAFTALHTAAMANPRAATVLAGLLRWSGGLPVPAALEAESFAYSSLLRGPEFRAWLQRRGPRPPPPPVPDPVLVARAGDELRITLNRPDRGNAYGRVLRDALVEALGGAVGDPSVRRVVVDGAGPVFCSGSDLDDLGTASDLVTAHLVRTRAGAARPLRALRDRVEVRLHGACVGAGIEVPAFAARVVAGQDTSIRLPDVAMGLIPGAGGTVSIPRRIGRWRTLHLALSGVSLDVRTAAAWGLVDRTT